MTKYGYHYDFITFFNFLCVINISNDDASV
jgi:hypothetical protein